MSHGLLYYNFGCVWSLKFCSPISYINILNIPILPPEGGPRMDTLPKLVGVLVPYIISMQYCSVSGTINTIISYHWSA